MRSKSLTALAALMAAAAIINLCVSAKAAPAKEQATAASESSDKGSVIRKQLQEVIDKEIKNQQGVLVALYLDAEDADNAATIARYRCFSRPGRKGSYSGAKSVPYRTPWTTWESVSDPVTREIVIDPGPPHKDFTKIVTLTPGEVTNLGHIVLERVKTEGTASIGGTITDENGKALEGVKVSSIRGVAHTNAEGFYRIDGFGLEEYELVASKDGYMPYRIRVPVRNLGYRTSTQDLVLSFRRKIRFRYAISPDGKDDFSAPDASSGKIEYFLEEKHFRIPWYRMEPGDFKDFVEGAWLGLNVNEDKLTLTNSNPPIFYKSLPSSSEEFEAITSIRTRKVRSWSCPPIQEGDIILIDGVKASGYTVKILFEKVQKLKPSEFRPPPKSPPTTFGVSYEDFPPHLQEILDKRIDEMAAKGGICIAGRVKLGDGASIANGKDIHIGLPQNVSGGYEVYEDGWFIMRRVSAKYAIGPEKRFVVRAFGYDPVDASITISDKQITYVGFEMKKTPADKLGSIKGIVTDYHNRPVEAAHVRITFPFGHSGRRPEVRTQTNQKGAYSFEGLSDTEHQIVYFKSGYDGEADRFTPPQGGIAVQDFKLYALRKIVVDFVYQADGSRSFTSGNLQSGTIEWDIINSGVIFSEGRAKRRGSSDDILLRQDKGVLKFDISHIRNSNGFYDAGKVAFDSVAEATQWGYSTNGRRCKIGHVYVVRTIDEAKYAKFIVKSIEAF